MNHREPSERRESERSSDGKGGGRERKGGTIREREMESRRVIKNVCVGDRERKEGSVDEVHVEGGERVERNRGSKRRG